MQNVQKMIDALKARIVLVDGAIVALERVQGERRLGRPPGSVNKPKAAATSA